MRRIGLTSSAIGLTAMVMSGCNNTVDQPERGQAAQQAPAPAPVPAPAPAAPENPYTATFVANRFRGGNAAGGTLPSGYTNGLIHYDPTTGALDPAFVSALGFGTTPMTVQQFQQYWNSPSTSNGNFGTP
jgi:hypothetical protein